MATIVESLANWARSFDPEVEDYELARRALVDTAGVTLAARDHPLTGIAAELPDLAGPAVPGGLAIKM